MSITGTGIHRISGTVLAALFLCLPRTYGQDPNGPFPQQPAEPADVAGPGVARISLINGDVSVRRGDSGDFVAAAINAPLMVQDYMSTGPSGRAEVQFDYGNMVRLGANTEVRFVAMESNHYQMQIARGTVTYRVRTETPSQVELSTPSVAVRPVRRGSYRVAVSDDGQTQITVHTGDAEVYTPKGVERIRAGQTMMVRGTPENPEFQVASALARDDWDMWNEQRDRQLDQSRSYQYMSRDIYGGEDLDIHGRWLNDPQYGNVWSPYVSAGWAPYRVGRWAWEDYYGWTWVSGDPWGWAPYHYGSWYNGALGWCWYPGPIHARHFWRPALVAFFGFGGGAYGGHGGFGFGNVGWVPLAPFEHYRPWYGRGFGGYGRGGINNINIVNNTNITNVYRNARYANGITGVNAEDFAGGRFHNTLRVSPDQVRQAGLVHGALPLAPTNGALRFSDRQTQAMPRNVENQGRFYSRSQPTAGAGRVPFEQQRQSVEQLSGGQGRRFGTQPGTASDPAGNRGWNRFGNPGVANTQSSGTTWVRQGSSPSSAVAPQEVPASPGFQRSQNSGNTNSAWGRFGSPRGDAGSVAPQSGIRNEPRVQQPGSGGWSRYENRSENPAPRNFSSPDGWAGQNRHAQSSQPSAPLQISPPIVRERSAPQHESPPSYSAPREQRNSAPSGTRGGGGYSAPRSSGYSGAYSAPHSGGGQSGGGGGNQGGGSGGNHGGRGR